MTEPAPRLDAGALRELASDAASVDCDCVGVRCAGWESLPSSFDEALLHEVGTLAVEGDEEPTIDEFHPGGTNYWAPDAPIALGCFPYNRCSVWRCRECGRTFLRYTEYGGYYIDHRIREVKPELVVDGGAAAA